MNKQKTCPRIPTRQQREIARLCLDHPEWTAKRILLTAGYSPVTADVHSKEILSSPGVQTATEELRRTYRGALSTLLPAEEAAQRLVGLAMQNDQPGTALSALTTVLEHAGIVEPRDKAQVMVLCFQAAAERIGPVMMRLMAFVPAAEKEQIAREIADATGAHASV